MSNTKPNPSESFEPEAGIERAPAAFTPVEAGQGGTETGAEPAQTGKPRKAKVSVAERATKATVTRKTRKSKPKEGIPSKPPEDTYKPEPYKVGPLAEELDADEAEFRAIRQDLDGVK